MRILLFGLFSLFLQLGSVSAQSASPFTAAIKSRSYHRMPASFTGYAVELTTSDRPLTTAFPLFKNFGNIHYDKLQRGRYTYLIPVGFTKRESVEKYVADVIHPRVPKATIVEYQNGLRLDSKALHRKRRLRFD